LHDRGLSTAVGDEVVLQNLAGGTEDALDTIKSCRSWIYFGDEIMIALDCAAAEFLKWEI
jgi:enolase